MRTINFRDGVLWAIAYKMGLDPATNFQRNQAYAIATYINSWVRRLWDSADFPEWTVTARFIPSTAPLVAHNVNWNQPPHDYVRIGGDTDGPSGVDDVDQLAPGPEVPLIGKVLKVYLVDPRTTWAPVETPFRLGHLGIHCGFDHGPSVWIKYIPRCPRFTANEWIAATRYNKDDLVYSPTSGECYKSKSSNNLGHDPSQAGSTGSGGGVTQSLQVDETQGAPDNPGLAATTKILEVFPATAYPLDEPIPDPPAAGASGNIEVRAAGGVTVLGSATHTATGSESLAVIFTDLAAQLTTALTGFTVTLSTTPLKIRVEHASDFVIPSATAIDAMTTSTPLSVVQVQPYVPATAPVAGHGQQLELTITEEQVIPGATYVLTFTSVDDVEHEALYVALPNDNAQQILSGLIDSTIALQGADPFFTGVQGTLDATSPSATFTISPTVGTVSLHPVVEPPGSSFWNYVPFPFALVDPVVQGTLADVRGEQGQTDKKTVEENLVVPEMQVRLAAQSGKDYDPLSDQARTHSRYAVK
jgi:hypothetical protein